MNNLNSSFHDLLDKIKIKYNKENTMNLLKHFGIKNTNHLKLPKYDNSQISLHQLLQNIKLNNSNIDEDCKLIAKHFKLKDFVVDLSLSTKQFTQQSINALKNTTLQGIEDIRERTSTGLQKIISKFTQKKGGGKKKKKSYKRLHK